MKKNWKAMAFFLAASLLSTGWAVPAKADSVKAKTSVSVSGTEKKITLSKLSYDLYENDDNIDIDFSTKVSWKKGASASVTDEKGKKYTTSITDKDKDDLELYVEDLAKDHTYKIKVTGIKARTASSYGTLTISFSIPADKKNASSSNSAIQVKDIDYDWDDGELDIDFRTKVSVKSSASATITDQNGKKYDAEITDYDSDDCTISVYDPLEYGKTYTLRIDGIKARTADKYGTFSYSFEALDD